jgi:hypothetical protein
MPIVASGIAEAKIASLRLSKIRLNRIGSGTKRDPETVAEQTDAYPEATMFGVLPARILFCRHATDVRIAEFTSHSAMKGPAADDMVIIHCNDVKGRIDTDLP